MSLLKRFILLVLLGAFNFSVWADEPISYLWVLDNLTEIDGIPVYTLGDPEVVDTDLGKAIKFDGNGDRILVDANPIETSKAYTVEVIFKADAGTLNQNSEPRFIHIQNPDDPKQKRVMMEIRVNSDNKVYLDGFMLTDNDKLALIDETKFHDTEAWVHAAITYDGTTFATYINGVQELTGAVGYENDILDEIGQTSIGARMDKRNWYSGLVKCLKVTQAKISPDKFMTVADFKATNTDQLKEANISIYPIPATSHFTINLNGDSSFEKAVLYDLSGAIVKEDIIVSDQTRVETDGLKDGIYFLKLSGGNGQGVHKIEVMH